MTSERTPKELADAVRAALPEKDGCIIRWHFTSEKEPRDALAELERIATEKPMQESLCARVARLEEKVGPIGEFKTQPPKMAIDPGLKMPGLYFYNAFTAFPAPGVEAFKDELGNLTSKHGVHVDVSSIRVATHAGKLPGWCLNFPGNKRNAHMKEFEAALGALCDEHSVQVDLLQIVKTRFMSNAAPGFKFVDKACSPSPLPPAESCAHAVERFREALLLLTKRHEVEVEIGHIEPGSTGGGIEDLPDQDEEAAKIDADYRAEFDEPVRERKAWDAIEAWQDRSPAHASRSAESRRKKRPPLPRMANSVVLDQRESNIRMCDGQRVYSNTSKAFHGTTRLVALEVAAAWCEGQK